MQENLFPEMAPKKNDNTKMIGANLSLVFNRSNKNLVTLKNRDLIVKKVDLSDKPAKKWVCPDFPNNLVHGKCCLNNLIDENRSIGFNRCGSVRQRA